MRLNAQQAATFPANGKTSFLSLANDGDSAVVRFAYENVEQIPIYLVHDVVGEDGKYKQLGCLRNDFSQPESVCPLCASGNTPKKAMYFNVRNEETGEMQIWQRSEAYFKSNMEILFNEYVKGGTPLCNIPFKIVRKGAKGDTQTKYTFIALPATNMPLAEFPEEIVVEEEGIVKDYSFNELQNYINTGRLPSNNNQEQGGIRPRGQQAPQAYAPQAPVAHQAAPAYAQQAQQAPVNNNRRTIMNNNGY